MLIQLFPTVNAVAALGIYYYYQNNLDISSLICPATLLLLKVFEALCNAKNLAYLENGKSNERNMGGSESSSRPGTQYGGDLGIDFTSLVGANRGERTSPLTI